MKLTPEYEDVPILEINRGLSKLGLKKANEELGENDQIKHIALKELRQLLDEKSSSNPGSEILRKIKNENDKYILRFLRVKKFDVQLALQQITGYIRYHEKYPEIVQPINISEIRQRIEAGQPGVLPKRSPDGRVILIFKIKEWDATKYPFWKVVQTYAFLLELLLQSQETQVHGVTILEDFSGYTLSQMAAVGLSDYKRMIKMFEGSFPVRFKGVHFIKQPSFFVHVFNLIKRTFDNKLLNRVYLYGNNLEKLFGDLPQDFLPQDFGGTAPPYDGVLAANLLLGSATEE